MYDDCAEVAFKATPADYIFTDENISWNIKDAKNNTFEEDPLDIYVEDNCVIVKINENTDYGATYKVNLVPEETGKAVTLTVKTLAETKSAVKVAVTAKGKLITGDIESVVVITPKWTNLTGGTDITENIKVYATDKVKNSKDVTELFDIKLNADDTYALRVKDYASLNELNPKDKYSVAVEDVMVKGHVIETGKAVNVTMTLTKAKVEQNTKTVNLYLNDKNSRGEFVLTLKDKNLPAIAKVELADNNISEFYQLADLGNGKFAVEFKDNEIAEKIKAGTVKINIYLEGNNPENKTPNATISVKVNNVKFKTAK